MNNGKLLVSIKEVNENDKTINSPYNVFRKKGPQAKNARDLKGTKVFYDGTLYCIKGKDNKKACLRVLDKAGAIGNTNNVFYNKCGNSFNYQTCYFDDKEKAEAFLANCDARKITSGAKVEEITHLQNERSFFKAGTICGDCLIQAYKLNEDKVKVAIVTNDFLDLSSASSMFNIDPNILSKSENLKSFINLIDCYLSGFPIPVDHEQIINILEKTPISILYRFLRMQLLVKFDDSGIPSKGKKVDSSRLSILLNKLKELKKSFPMSSNFDATFFSPLETIILCLMGEGEQADKIEKMGDIESIVFCDRNAKIIDNGGRELAREIVDLIKHPFMKILGTYNHKKKLITIYLRNIDDDNDIAYVFIHEFFHAIHYLLRDLKDPKHSSFIKDENKIDIVLESFASYFEYCVAEAFENFKYIDKLKLLLKRNPLPYYPYSGIKYIKFDEFKKILGTSLLSADCAYDMFIPKYINPKQDVRIKIAVPKTITRKIISFGNKSLSDKIVLIFATLLLSGNLEFYQLRQLCEVDFCQTNFGRNNYPIFLSRKAYLSLSELEQNLYSSKEYRGYRIYTKWSKKEANKVFDYLEMIVKKLER